MFKEYHPRELSTLAIDTYKRRVCLKPIDDLVFRSSGIHSVKSECEFAINHATSVGGGNDTSAQQRPRD